LILVPRLLSLLGENETFVIVDAGAREAERDQRWRPFPPERMEFVGFEPDKEEAARLNSAAESAGLKNHFVAAGLWGASGAIEFEHNNIGGGSSFLAQNRKLTDRWKFENPNEARLAREIFFPIKRESMTVVSLADWAKDANVRNVDFLKLNVQGSEAEILNGAGPLLDGILAFSLKSRLSNPLAAVRCSLPLMPFCESAAFVFLICWRITTSAGPRVQLPPNISL
jgi:FkbM family methyltransferase